MDDSQKPQLMKLLSGVMASYGKPLPEAGIINAWVANLRPYSMPLIEAAFQAYLDQNGEFAPVPAGIAMRCKKMDGRPDDEEAWAIALTARDEASTVVWTQETAQAFDICRTVLMSSNAICARKSFLAAHARLVADSRTAHRPMKIIVSLGSDRHHRATVIKRAVDNGLLLAPAAAPLLEGTASDPTPSPGGRAQLAKIKKEMADAAEKKEQARFYRVEHERLADEEFKRSTNVLVQQYLEGIKT
jgi:hypothetical protein